MPCETAIDWMDLRRCRVEKNILPCRESNLRNLVRSLSLYRLNYWSSAEMVGWLPNKFLRFWKPLPTLFIICILANIHILFLNTSSFLLQCRIKSDSQSYWHLYWRRKLNTLRSSRHLTFCVTGFNLVRPVTAVGVLVESKSFRAVEHISSAVHTVHELSAVSAVTKPEVAILVGTVACGLASLCNTWPHYVPIEYTVLWCIWWQVSTCYS